MTEETLCHQSLSNPPAEGAEFLGPTWWSC
jgi:hypothetical protein